MRARPSDYESVTSLTLAELNRYGAAWNTDGRIRQLSPRTLQERVAILGKLRWWAEQTGVGELGALEFRQFLLYVNTGHINDGGRWGKPGFMGGRLKRPVRPATALAYFRTVRAFLRWLEEELPGFSNPIATLRPPRVPVDQIQPFSEDQLQRLREAARKSRAPARDEALILFLFDTGVRSEELTSLCLDDVDLPGKRASVLGKGNKRRAVFFGRTTAKALWAWQRVRQDEECDALFVSVGGHTSGRALTPNGVGQIVQALGKAAGVTGVRCSPHTFRHTFAISFLRSGGDIYTLKALLGHRTLTMVMRYLALAEADLETQHRLHSPADKLKRR